AILRGYRDGLTQSAVFRTVLGLDEEALGRRFSQWAGERFAAPLRGGAIAPWDGKSEPNGEVVEAIRKGKSLLEAGRREEARAELERAAAMFPEYTGPDAPLLLL